MGTSKNHSDTTNSNGLDQRLQNMMISFYNCCVITLCGKVQFQIALAMLFYSIGLTIFYNQSLLAERESQPFDQVMIYK